jgi:hypothetical protein
VVAVDVVDLKVEVVLHGAVDDDGVVLADIGDDRLAVPVDMDTAILADLQIVVAKVVGHGTDDVAVELAYVDEEAVYPTDRLEAL